MHGIHEEYDAANRPEAALVQNSGMGSRLYCTAASYDIRKHAGSRKERVSGANHMASRGYDWDDRAEDIRNGGAVYITFMAVQSALLTAREVLW